MTKAEATVYRSSLTHVRDLLDRSGGAHGVSPRDLSACEADILVIEKTADHHGRPGSPIARFYTLSDDVRELCQRLRTRVREHRLAPGTPSLHVHQTLPPVAR